MSLQIKKRLSAGAVGTDLYRNGRDQMKRAYKQAEWCKIDREVMENRKKGRPECPTGWRSAEDLRPSDRLRMEKSWSSVWESDLRGLEARFDCSSCFSLLTWRVCGSRSGSWNDESTFSCRETLKTQDQSWSSHGRWRRSAHSLTLKAPADRSGDSWSETTDPIRSGPQPPGALPVARLHGAALVMDELGCFIWSRRTLQIEQEPLSEQKIIWAVSAAWRPRKRRRMWAGMEARWRMARAIHYTTSANPLY